jgi:hypothetical protein|tara:strand:- start:1191 stop:1925 length:735 start_codon:yes stop_codon:yes gene_type:complete
MTNNTSNDFFEIDKLPKGHKHSVDHDCYNYESWWDYIDTTSNYHFDKTSDDTNHPGIDTSVKFRWKHDIKEEIEPFIREKSMNVHPNDIAILYKSWWYHQNDIRGLDHICFKENMKIDKHPTLKKIVDWFEYESGTQAIIMQMRPGTFDIYHVDTHDGHINGYGKKPLHRIIINLVDWEPGMFLIWGNKTISQWKAGDTISWDRNIPHSVANASRYTRYALRITGMPSEKTMEKIAKGGIVNIE